jgi:acetylornithine deacetylase
MPPASPTLNIVQRLIAFDTVSRNSNLDLIAFAQSMLERSGAKTRLTYDAAKTKANVFATLGPQRDGGYVLSGHTDVVPVDGQEWSSNPFSPETRDGRLYGRGGGEINGLIGGGICRARFETAAPFRLFLRRRGGLRRRPAPA